MSLEIIDFIPVALDLVQKGNWIKLGHVKLRLSDEISIIMEVIKGKDDGFFFKIPSVRVGDSFASAYDFSKQPEFSKNVTKQLKEEFKAKYL